jgi:biotin carboxylase
MTQTVLAVGAGPEQLTAIRKALDLGYRTIAIDGNANAPGLSIADKGIHMNIMDASDVLNLAKELSVEATLPVPLGNPLITQGIVNDALGLSGVSQSAAELCTNKAAFQRLATRHGVRMPCTQLEADIGDVVSQGSAL